ncbi:hypothetical protein [Flavobacterium ardleyense]|uniref:hypothetical protein n=1 Tax=Flavobacterium ardleyense TaxID=2038737 RepID=UPI00298BFA70|nr:hypothetical protein [Flavobacterium ardleyense]
MSDIYSQIWVDITDVVRHINKLWAIERSKLDKRLKIESGILAIKTENKIRLIFGQALQEDLLKMYFQSEDA